MSIYETHEFNNLLDYKRSDAIERTLQLPDQKRHIGHIMPEMWLQYIGQTGNTFNERFRAHLTDIRQQNTVKPVSRHFTTNSHSVHDINAAVLTTTTGNVNVRLRTEEVLIYKFQSRSPSGLNLIQ